MTSLSTILLFTFFGSIVSLLGGIVLLYKKDFIIKFSGYLGAFAAGSLLGAAFFDLLPEALAHAGDGRTILIWALAGILIFFFLERAVHWFHHHQHEHVGELSKPTGVLIILGDTVHNFIDGIAIAITFLIDPSIGIITTIAIASHEIPQEIGDFALLLKLGYSRKQVLLYNALSAGAALVGALLTYAIGPQITVALPALLAITAGFFIYISMSDLIPEIHLMSKKKLAIAESLLLILGAAVVGLLVRILE